MAIGNRIPWAAALVFLPALCAAGERLQLGGGLVELSSPILAPDGAADFEIVGAMEGTTLRASADFSGPALIVARNTVRLTVRNVTIDGNRAVLEKPSGLPPYDVPFHQFTASNGILVEGGSTVLIEDVRLREIAGFAVLVARSKNVKISRVTVQDSGGRNDKKRNNTTGGILLEDGTSGFEVTDSTFRNILGNGVWTHSRYESARNRDGLIARNRFDGIGRDAIQIGHATSVRVERNTGSRIGYPVDAVDVENGGTPVAIDTAGNVDKTEYVQNRFEEINGKCIDLDGFHNGLVEANTCINRKHASEYPFGHYGIVFNNTNPDMRSENIVVRENVIEGAKYGGIFVIGRGHTIVGNRLQALNQARCDDCQYFEGEPDLLRSGIYLGRRAERPDPATGNRIQNNIITGYKMDQRCIGAAPGVSLSANTIRANTCKGNTP
jgi:hypothetical protein